MAYVLCVILPQLIQLAQARPHDAMQEEFVVHCEQDIYNVVLRTAVGTKYSELHDDHLLSMVIGIQLGH